MVKKELSEIELSERAKNPTFIRFGLWYPVAAIFASLLLVVIGMVVAIKFGFDATTIKSDMSVALIINDIMFLTIAGLVILGVKLSKKSLKELFSIKGLKPKTVILTGLAYAMLQPFIALLTYGFQLISGTEISGNSTDILQNKITIVSIIAVSILAPLFEELYFRGALFDGLLNSLRKFIPTKDSVRVALTVVVTAGIFGLMHMNDTSLSSIVTVVTITLIGVSFAILRIKTRSLALGMFAHFIFNTTGLGLVAISLSVP